MLNRIVVGGAWEHVDWYDAFQRLSGSEQVGQRSGVVESGVVQDNRNLLRLIGFARQARHDEDDLLGVLIAVDGVDLHLLACQAQGPEEGLRVLLAIHMQFSALALGEPHAPRFYLMFASDLVDGADLPAVFQEIGDLAANLGHALGDGVLVPALVEGVGQLEAHARQAQQQLVGRIRLVCDTESDRHHIPKGRHVPEDGLDAGLGRQGRQDALQLFFLGG